MNTKFLVTACAASLLFAASAQAQTASPTKFYAADVVSVSAFNWGSGADAVYDTSDDVLNTWGQIGLSTDVTVGITNAYPHTASGDEGSLQLQSNGNANGKGGLAYYPAGGFGKFSELTGASFDYLVASSGDPAPVMRLFLFDETLTSGATATPWGTHVATLIWTSGTNGITVPQGTWQTANVFSGKVWQSKNGGPQYSQTPIDFADAQSHADFQNLTVRAVEVGYGSGGWSAQYNAAVDNVVLRSSNPATTPINVNFEVTKPSSPVQPVPTTSHWGLMLLATLSAALGVRGARRRRLGK